MSELNPCMTCGACCAWFRVSFYWAEGDDAGGIVPSHLTEQVTPFLRCMSGTLHKPCRCVALEGAPGESVRCTIYENRPTPCREFAMSGENGVVNDACNRARAAWGLPPLGEISSLSGLPLNAATAESSRVQLPAD
ncbi:YkgJ family cysteine cluster protein [Franconibacter pulveris]|uniref:YkgJ family cysteine cluster protein n=1 Tax=Franconibacter pulveris TaxID=435910 RepID=UPI0008FF47E3|nr:YkgJ family cysteine cluster protein [Franconibacter pulveris]HBI09040.1 YkgJ family cysteine cluster protein [Franconibacter pulveris]